MLYSLKETKLTKRIEDDMMMSFLGFLRFSLFYSTRIFLQNGYGIIDYIVLFLGPGTVLFFTFYLLWAGRRKNHKIMDLARDALLEVFEKEFDDLVMEEKSSNGGLLIPKYKKTQNISFKDFRVVFALEERHLLLSVVISWFSGANDYIALEANATKGKLPTKIQIIPKHEEGQIKKHQDLLFSLKDIILSVEKLDSHFVIKASSKPAGLYYLGEKSLLRQLYSIRQSVVRISINSSEDPSVRLYCRINKELDFAKVSRFFVTMCKRIDDVHEKKAMQRI